MNINSNTNWTEPNRTPTPCLPTYKYIEMMRDELSEVDFRD